MDIATASKDDLINFLAEQGVELTGTERIDTLRNMAKPHLSAPVVELTPQEILKHNVNNDKGFAPKLSGKRVKVKIHRTATSGDSVFLGLNGVGYRVKTDTEVELPIEVVNSSLRDARQTIFQKVGNDMVPTEAQAYPYQILQ